MESPPENGRFKNIEDLPEASASSPIVPSILGHEARSGISPRGEGQDGTFALNFLARAASVVSHRISRSVPVRNRSIHSGGSTEKSILWRPQSGRRPSSSVKPYSRASSHELRRKPV